MPRFYEPDLTANFDNPFVRDANNKLVRRSYWLDMDDKTLVLVMTKGIGANLTNHEKRTHLADIRRARASTSRESCMDELRLALGASSGATALWGTKPSRRQLCPSAP